MASVWNETVFKDKTFALCGAFNFKCSLDTIGLLRPEQPEENILRLPNFGPKRMDEWELLSSIRPEVEEDWKPYKADFFNWGYMLRMALNMRFLPKLKVGDSSLIVTHERLVESAVAELRSHKPWPPEQVLNPGDVFVVTYMDNEGYEYSIHIVKYGQPWP